jgi:hypothetical protein
MKFVNRHERKIIGVVKSSRRQFFAMRQMVAIPVGQSVVAGHIQAILHFAFSFNGQHLGCGHGAFAKGD